MDETESQSIVQSPIEIVIEAVAIEQTVFLIKGVAVIENNSDERVRGDRVKTYTGFVLKFGAVFEKEAEEIGSVVDRILEIGAGLLIDGVCAFEIL